jgi:hypothetical protein
MAMLTCKIMGFAFLIVAVWGFIDGHEVLIFHVNTAHNIVHLLSGLCALACGFAGPRPARLFCLIFGSVYGLVAVLGFLNVEAINKLLHLNDADDWLHLVIALAFLGAVLSSKPAHALDSKGDEHVLA